MYIDEPYITVVAQVGMCNKLQVLLSHLYKANEEGKKLRIIWTLSEDCPEKFNNLFNDIENVEIIYSDEKLEPLINNDYKTWDKIKNNFIIDKYYKLLVPKPTIQKEIDNTKLLLGEKYIACHIRKTDALTHQWYSLEVKKDDEYINFINSHPPDLKIYIATDCRITQQKFIDLYRDRIVYKKIEDNNNLRQTSLQDAVKDIFVCVDATYFMRAVGSFSDTIEYIRQLKN